MPNIVLAGEVLFEDLDTDVAVYLVATRETHIVDRVGGKLLRALAGGGMSLEQMFGVLREDSAGGSEEELWRYLEAALARWTDAGLVSR